LGGKRNKLRRISGSTLKSRAVGPFYPVRPLEEALPPFLLASLLFSSFLLLSPSLSLSENLDVPGCFLACEIDQQLTTEKRQKAIAITEKNSNERGVFSKWVYYPKVSHGWSVRSDPGDLYADRAAKDAANVVMAWFGTI